MDLTQHELIHAGQGFELAAGLLADVENVAFRLRAGAWNGQIDLGDPVLLDRLENILTSADDGHIIQITPPLVGVIVNDAADHIMDLL